MTSLIVRSAGAMVAGVFFLGCAGQEPVPRSAGPAGPPAAMAHPSVQTTGATNMQPSVDAEASAPAGPLDYRTNAAQVVAVASRQMDRLERASTGTGTRRWVGVDAALADLASKRAKVVDDMRELDEQPAMQEESAFGEIDRCADLAALQSAVRASSSILAPASRRRP
jgi:hypothetical protein